MTNRHYRNGRAFEYRVAKRLEEQGFTVFRTAGSHTPVDLLAFRPMVGTACVDVRFVQCKGGITRMTRRERQSFREFAERLGATPVVFTRGMVEEPA